MKINVICPLYNAANYVLPLHRSLCAQVGVDIEITYILTPSKDNTSEILQSNQIAYTPLAVGEFSHSLTREKFALQSTADILVFITQDVQIRDPLWLKKLTEPLVTGECAAAFARQIAIHKGIERYTREYNYPAVSFINSQEDIAVKGLKAFAFSDAASAVKADVFRAVNGYDGKDMPFNEDMYLARKIITRGYRIKYCADAVVYHSHQLTLKQLYRRYYLAGQSMALNPELDQYGTTKAGGSLAKYVLKAALKHFDLWALLCFIPNMLARYLGMRKGRASVKG